MGNCQAAEAATLVIQHPGNKIEKMYWSISAHQVMYSNPGYYVAVLVTSPPTAVAATEKSASVKQLKLLRPDDILVIGQVYRLISFEGTDLLLFLLILENFKNHKFCDFFVFFEYTVLVRV